MARFTQGDTIVPDEMDPQAWNRYAYVAFPLLLTVLGIGVLSSCFLDDPARSPLDRDEVLEIAANSLCPADPESVRRELYASLDSGLWRIYVGRAGSAVRFHPYRSGGEWRIQAASREAREYQDSLPPSCFNDESPKNP